MQIQNKKITFAPIKLLGIERKPNDQQDGKRAHLALLECQLPQPFSWKFVAKVLKICILVGPLIPHLGIHPKAVSSNASKKKN